MDTAVKTGMFTTSFVSNQLVRKDVGTNNKDGFKSFFNESLNNKKVENEGVETNKAVKEKDNVKEEYKTEKTDENKDIEKTKDDIKTKDKVKKKKDVPKKEVSQEVSEESLKKLDELLEKLDIDPSEMLENTDVCENVDEVGLQLVETEEITLNLKDENENKDVELNEEVDVLGENENLSSFENYMQENSDESMLNDKEESKDSKLKIKDFRTNTDSSNIGDVNNRSRFNIEDVNLKQSGVVNNGIVNNITDMQEKIDVLKQVTEQMDVSLFDEKAEMVMKLKPDDLGKVTVKLSLENGIISAKFLAESEKVKEILETNFNQLKESLEKQGMMIQEFSVSVDNGNSQEKMFYERRNKLFNKKVGKIDNSYDYNNIEYYDYGEADVNNYWPDSTISFSA